MLTLFVLSVSSGEPGWSMSSGARFRSRLTSICGAGRCRPSRPTGSSRRFPSLRLFEFRVAEFRVVCSSGSSSSSSSSSSMKRDVVVTSASDIRHRIKFLDDVDSFCACRFIWRAWVEHGSRSGASEHADFYLRSREVSAIATYRFKEVS